MFKEIQQDRKRCRKRHTVTKLHKQERKRDAREPGGKMMQRLRDRRKDGGRNEIQ